MLSLKDISKNRSFLMGLSIVLIMLCHNSLYFVGNCYWINEYVKRLFQCGVDCFFILSGIGCYSSIKKNNVMKFYFRRIEATFFQSPSITEYVAVLSVSSAGEISV